MKKFGIKMVFYIDRISFYVDGLTHKNDLAPLTQFNPQNKLTAVEDLDGSEINDDFGDGKNKYTFQMLSLHHEHLDKKVDLFQPSKNDLLLLADNHIVQGDYAITYIEFAVDFIMKNKKIRRQLLAFFDKHLVYEAERKNSNAFHFNAVGKKDKLEAEKKHTSECIDKEKSKHKKERVYLSNCTCKSRYFTPYREKDGLIMYSDKPTKTSSKKPCIHIEKRFRGLESVKKIGLYTFRNVIEFKQRQFWSQHFDLRKPNYAGLGRLNPFRKKGTERDADGKRGRKVYAKFSSLQEYLQDNERSIPAFQNIKTKKQLEEQLKEYLELIERKNTYDKPTSSM